MSEGSSVDIEAANRPRSRVRPSRPRSAPAQDLDASAAFHQLAEDVVGGVAACP